MEIGVDKSFSEELNDAFMIPLLLREEVPLIGIPPICDLLAGAAAILVVVDAISLISFGMAFDEDEVFADLEFTKEFIDDFELLYLWFLSDCIETDDEDRVIDVDIRLRLRSEDGIAIRTLSVAA